VNTPEVWCIGPHQYKIVLTQVSSSTPARLTVEYNLWGINGFTVTPREGKLNAHGWVTSTKTWPNTTDGRAEAVLWIDQLLRPQDVEND